MTVDKVSADIALLAVLSVLEVELRRPAQWSQMDYKEKLVVHLKTQTIA